jgi:hypothetical protein
VVGAPSVNDVYDNWCLDDFISVAWVRVRIAGFHNTQPAPTTTVRVSVQTSNYPLQQSDPEYFLFNSTTDTARQKVWKLDTNGGYWDFRNACATRWRISVSHDQIGTPGYFSISAMDVSVVFNMP